MIAREDYVGPITKAAEAMFVRAERRARGPAAKADPPAKRKTASINSPIHQALLDAGLTIATLRHWEDAGVIAFARQAGRRVVDDEAVARLNAVIQLRRAGFTVRQIAWLSPDAPPSLSQMRDALTARMTQVRAGRESNLRRLRARA